MALQPLSTAATPSRTDALAESIAATMRKHRYVRVPAENLREALDPDAQFRSELEVTQRNATSYAFLAGMNRMFGSPTKSLQHCVEEFAEAHGWTVSQVGCWDEDLFHVYEFSTQVYQPQPSRSDLVGRAIRGDLEAGATATIPVQELLRSLDPPSVYMSDIADFIRNRWLSPSLERLVTQFAAFHGLVATYDPRLCRYTFFLRSPGATP